MPSHYPQVPRLGLNWQVNPDLSLKADAYFALTPSAFMAGGHLEATWQSGNLRAWFHAGVDFFIGWQPHHYEGEASVSVGASYPFEFFGWHTVSVELTADLTIWGPPFSGIAHVQWYIISFDVAFGDRAKTPPKAVKWPDFRRSFLPDRMYTVAAQAGKVAQHGSRAQASANPNQSEHLGIVNPRELCIAVSFAMPITKPLGPLLTRPVSPPENISEPSIGIAPLSKQHGQWDCTLEITIQHDKVQDVSEQFHALPMRHAVPAALWGEELEPKPGTKPLIENAICGYQIQPLQLVSFASPPAVSTTENPHHLPLDRPIVGPLFGIILAQNQQTIHIKDTVQRPDIRHTRRAILKGLSPETDIDWSGVTVEAWRADPRIVHVGIVNVITGGGPLDGR
jgi:hypothetical protein